MIHGANLMHLIIPFVHRLEPFLLRSEFKFLLVGTSMRAEISLACSFLNSGISRC